jgi:hypothetical protein
VVLVPQAFDKVWHNGLSLNSNNFYQKNFTLYSKVILRKIFSIFCQTTGCYNRDLRDQIKYPSEKYPWTISVFVVHCGFTGIYKCFYCYYGSWMIQRYLQYRDLTSKYLQNNLNFIQNWLKLWRIKVNENKSIHITFTMCATNCLAVYLNRT